MHDKIKAEYQQLQEQKEAFINELGQLKTDQAPSEENWNPTQVMEHVIISEMGTLGYLFKKTSSGFDGIPSADDEIDAAASKLNIALESKGTWKAPPVMPSPTGEKSIEVLMAEWGKLREKYEAFLGQFPEEHLDKLVFKHPYAGRLTLLQTLQFLHKHILHHRWQLERISA